MQKSVNDVLWVPQAILEVARTYPHATALSRGEEKLTYEELDLRAGRFAGYLGKSGVGPGSTVALCMERSFDWIICALGILRCGAAYVPLDSAWPDLRLRFAIEDSGASALVARTPLFNRLELAIRGIDPCRHGEAIAAADPAETAAIDPGSLAYVIYTSGSTGTPKGVEITHANLCHLVEWHREAFSIGRLDRASHLAGLGFDAAVWEIWPNLAAGATVCLPEDAERASPEIMQQWIVRERVTIAFVPTVLAAPLMALPWPSDSPLRFLLTGGDALHCSPPAGLPFAVVNNYGPTECSVVATSAVLAPGAPGVPAIGRAIAGANVYLLNERGVPVPPGSVGEICIGGNGVGRGYRNRPEATRRSFVPDPFTSATGARMYLTGDLGLRRVDGQVEFRGRMDRQVKIRGHRIELDEVEHALAQHSAVDFAAAIAHLPPGGETQLVAYILPRDAASVPTTTDLRRHLRRSLPEFMIPAQFLQLKDLPLSPNGKIDLSQLPDPIRAQPLRQELAPPASNSLADELICILREILQNDDMNADDNFFEAGGHSLLGMQLLIRLRKTFGIETTLRQLFEAPTVTRLARLIEAGRNGQRVVATSTELPPCNRIESDSNLYGIDSHPMPAAVPQSSIANRFGRHASLDTLSLSSTTGKTYFAREPATVGCDAPAGVLSLHSNTTRRGMFWIHYLSTNLAAAMADDIPFHFVVLTREDIAMLGNNPGVKRVAACLMRKILTIQPEGPYSLGGLCAGGGLAYEIACQLKAAGHEVSHLTMLDTPNPLRFESWISPARISSLVRYCLGGLAKLDGLKRLGRLCMDAQRRLGFMKPWYPRGSEMEAAIKMVHREFFSYVPGKYDGEVLFILSTEQTPYSKLHHAKVLAGWEGTITGKLRVEYRACEHAHVMREPNVSSVAHTIASWHRAVTGDACAGPSCSSENLREDLIRRLSQGHPAAVDPGGPQPLVALATSRP
ncbi:MAG TPA: amino acid adenylation domain-containing protein [Terracidiphilus sp.]|jgi:amino acid adenylation domain-containing protein